MRRHEDTSRGEGVERDGEDKGKVEDSGTGTESGNVGRSTFTLKTMKRVCPSTKLTLGVTPETSLLTRSILWKLDEKMSRSFLTKEWKRSGVEREESVG